MELRGGVGVGCALPDPARRSSPAEGADADRPPRTIAVVVNTYNQSHLLGEALDSIVAQTRRPDEILVVDDGSADDPAPVVARYAGVETLRTDRNVGISAARNLGMGAVGADLIVFLDGDDRLLPNAIQAGLDAMAAAPDSAFVCGGHRQVDKHWRPITADLRPAAPLTYEDLLRRNSIAMHAAVVYRRDRLLEIGGFDPTLSASEDYDVYLRLAQSHPVASHAEVVAEYRKHGENSSDRGWAMLVATLTVHGRHRPDAGADPQLARAWREGRAHWSKFYLRVAARGWRKRIKARLKRWLGRAA